MTIELVCDNKECQKTITEKKDAVEVIVGIPNIEAQHDYWVDSDSNGVFCSLECAKASVKKKCRT